jgi:hypothetical protein
MVTDGSSASAIQKQMCCVKNVTKVTMCRRRMLFGNGRNTQGKRKKKNQLPVRTATAGIG